VRVALGFKAHSGWSALVVLGSQGGEIHVIDRRRIELVEAGTAHWAKQPYHAAEGLNATDARDLVRRGVESAQRIAVREIEAAILRAGEAGHVLAGCAILVPEPMPDWSIDEILAVHIRMHKAEGVLFPDALVRAAKGCELTVLAIPEKRLSEHAERALATPMTNSVSKIAALGKSVGSPWGKDQKTAALAAMIALESH
jgi:hypothetical protein